MVPVSPTRRYPDGMEQDADPQEPDTEFLGIPVTPEGKARARKLLNDAAAKRTPEALASMRAKIGMPAAPSRA